MTLGIYRGTDALQNIKIVLLLMPQRLPIHWLEPQKFLRHYFTNGVGWPLQQLLMLSGKVYASAAKESCLPERNHYFCVEFKRILLKPRDIRIWQKNQLIKVFISPRRNPI